jgi:hypothetical protein
LEVAVILVQDHVTYNSIIAKFTSVLTLNH